MGKTSWNRCCTFFGQSPLFEFAELSTGSSRPCRTSPSLSTYQTNTFSLHHRSQNGMITHRSNLGVRKPAPFLWTWIAGAPPVFPFRRRATCLIKFEAMFTAGVHPTPSMDASSLRFVFKAKNEDAARKIPPHQ